MNKSEEGIVAFLYINNFVVVVLDITEDGEMMVVREVSSFDLELIEDFIMMNSLCMNLLKYRILQFVFQMMVVFEQLLVKAIPMILDMNINLNLYV